jgi:hypothetical protein
VITRPRTQKGLLPQYFNKAKNFDYVGPHPESKYYGADYIRENERAQFLERYEQKEKNFRNKEELLAYGMDDVNFEA